MTRWRAALAAILAVAACLRVWGLGAEGLWADEAFVVALSSLDLRGLLRLALDVDTHPPLHAWLLHEWMRLFGRSELAVRSLSLLFGVAGVAALARLGARLLGEEAGLYASLLLATSPYHVYYSQETRGYTLLVLLGIVSWDALLALLPITAGGSAARGPGRYVLATALMMYTQPYALFILIAQNLYVLGAHRTDVAALRRWLRAQLLVAALFAPWLPILAGHAARTQRSFWIERPELSHLLIAFVQYAGSAPAAVALGALIVLAVVSVARGAPPLRRTGVLLGLWLTLPQVVPFVVSQVATPMYLARAAIVSLPALLLLAVVPLRAGSRPVARAIVGGLAALSVFSLWQYRGLPARDQWRETAAHVAAQAARGDLVAIDDGYGGYAFDYYKRPDLDVLRLRDDVGRAEGAARLQDALDGRPRVWLVRYHRPPDHEAVRRALGEEWRLVDYRVWRNILLYRFERR